jgi:hypothetical protein
MVSCTKRSDDEPEIDDERKIVGLTTTELRAAFEEIHLSHQKIEAAFQVPCRHVHIDGLTSQLSPYVFFQHVLRVVFVKT